MKLKFIIGWPMKRDYRPILSNIRGLAMLLIILLAQTSGTLRADTVAWPVSVATPTGMQGEVDSKPVSVGVSAVMLGEVSSKPVSVALPFSAPDNSYMSKPVSGVVQAEPDCDGPISIAKVQGAINMYLGLKAVDTCVDTDGSGGVSIAEVQRMINLYLGL